MVCCGIYRMVKFIRFKGAKRICTQCSLWLVFSHAIPIVHGILWRREKHWHRIRWERVNRNFRCFFGNALRDWMHLCWIFLSFNFRETQTNEFNELRMKFSNKHTKLCGTRRIEKLQRTLWNGKKSHSTPCNAQTKRFMLNVIEVRKLAYVSFFPSIAVAIVSCAKWCFQSNRVIETFKCHTTIRCNSLYNGRYTNVAVFCRIRALTHH